jgi:hypothetical protein
MAIAPEAITRTQPTSIGLNHNVIRARKLTVTEHAVPSRRINFVTPVFLLPKQHTAIHARERAPSTTLIARESTRIVNRRGTASKHLRHTAVTSVRLNRSGNPHKFVLTEAPVAHVNSPGSKTQRFTVHQHQTLTLEIPSVDKRLAIHEHTVGHNMASQIAPPFVLTEHTHVKHRTTPDVRRKLEQTTEIHHRLAQHRRFHTQQHTHPMQHTTPLKKLKVHEHTAVKKLGHHVSVTHRFEQVTHVHKRTNLHVRRVIPYTTHIKHKSTPDRHLRPTVHHSVELSTPMLSIHHKVNAKTHVRARFNAHRDPFVMHQTAAVTRTSNVLDYLKIHQHIAVIHPSKHIRSTIKVIESPLLSVTTDITRNNVPVMGYIWQAIDVAGQQVPTLSDLHDYYFYLNNDTIPSLSWDFSDLQADATNDSYKFWKTK